jgi:hypothetical protein
MCLSGLVGFWKSSVCAPLRRSSWTTLWSRNATADVGELAAVTEEPGQDTDVPLRDRFGQRSPGGAHAGLKREQAPANGAL